MPRFRTIKAQCSYNRVLLATYVLADDDGAVCYATNAELAEACGLTVPTVKRYLRMLEHGGAAVVFSVPRVDMLLSGRCIVLLDHPDAVGYLEDLGSDPRNRLNPDSLWILPLIKPGTLAPG
jgi:hypothetical protein